MAEPLLEVAGLKTHFPILSKLLRRRVGTVKAVDGVDFAVAPGEVLGIVGESGSGKTTVGKSILRLIQPTEGSIRFEGRDITTLPAAEMMPLRARMQIVFQDPMSSLNPRMTIGRILAAPYEIHGVAKGQELQDRVAVMYLGRVVESGPREALFFNPKHPYTEALLAAVPMPEPGMRRARVPLGGDVPSPANPPPGCAFHPRCPRAMARCAIETPVPTQLGDGHVVACHLHGG